MVFKKWVEKYKPQPIMYSNPLPLIILMLCKLFLSSPKICVIWGPFVHCSAVTKSEWTCRWDLIICTLDLFALIPFNLQHSQLVSL